MFSMIFVVIAVTLTHYLRTGPDSLLKSYEYQYNADNSVGIAQNAHAAASVGETYMYDEQGHILRRQVARDGVIRMAHNQVFETKMTTHETVLNSGFPVSQWDPCTLEKIYQSKSALHMTILGGSCTARAARNCSSTGPLRDGRDYDPQDVLGGRFSNILERALTTAVPPDQSNANANTAMNISIANMGQGGM